MIAVRAQAGIPGSGGKPEWLQVIQTCNDIASKVGEPPLFGAPTWQGPWWAGGYVEEYPDARVILPDPDRGRAREEGALLVSKTDRGDRVLRRAAQRLGIAYQPVQDTSAFATCP